MPDGIGDCRSGGDQSVSPVSGLALHDCQLPMTGGGICGISEDFTQCFFGLQLMPDVAEFAGASDNFVQPNQGILRIAPGPFHLAGRNIQVNA